MAINVNHENVSPEQLTFLRGALASKSTREVSRLMYDIVTKDDIVNGEEDLDPSWLQIFRDRIGGLENAERVVPPRVLQALHRVFADLQSQDPLIVTIDPAIETIVFLLGAGASKPSPSGIPTVAELLPELLSRARRLDREQVTNLADFCDRQRIDNIEDLLTAVQISAFCSRNPRILSLVEFQLFGDAATNLPRHPGAPRPIRADVSSVAYLQDTLQVLFGLLSNLMLPADPNKGHQAIVEYLKEKPSTPIVTTNYDCCIDLALINNDVPFSYTVDFANPEVLANSSDTACQLIKLHGSLNWFYCETCQKVRLIDIGQTVGDYKKQRGEYPIISVCNECGGQRRGLLVPPHAMKFDVAPPLQPLIANAASCFEGSTLIVIVGFSFADADLYISRMLIKAMQESPKTRMVIVDPDASVIDKVRSKFEAQIPNFDPISRIVKLRGDCAEILPLFLEGGLLAKSDDDDTGLSPVGVEAVISLVTE